MNSKERRSDSCIDRSLLMKNKNRTSSLNEHRFDSSTESIDKYSTPKHELYKVKEKLFLENKKFGLVI